MKRKTSPIPPGVTMLYTDPMEYHLKESNLGHIGWWNPDLKDILSLKVRCSVILSPKASTSTIENNKNYLSRIYKDSLDMEDARRTGTMVSHYRGNSPNASIVPNITVQQVVNDPMIGIKVIGVACYLSNQQQTLILLPGDYLYTIDQTSFVEAVARGDVINGVLQGEFVWASNGSRYFLVKKDSQYYNSLLKTE